MSDLMLLWMGIGLLTLGAVLRVLLAKKYQVKLTVWDMIHACLFPAVLVIAAIAYMAGMVNLIIPAVLVGLLEGVVYKLCHRK